MWIKYIYLAVFIVFSVAHLLACLKHDRTFRAVTKGFIVFSLFGFYTNSVEEPSYLVVIALLLSWIGDLFLIGRTKTLFAIGGVSFALSHLTFCFCYIEKVGKIDVNPIIIVVSAIFYLIFVVVLFFKFYIKFIPKELFYPMFGYLLINAGMNQVALCALISAPGLNTAFIMVGAVLFFISDTLQFFAKFSPGELLQSHVHVMFTYILAEFFIVLGLIL